jgi:hypothetical protein
MAFIAPSKRIRFVVVLVIIKEIIVKGANFCHVDRIKHEIQDIDVITDVYHK